MKWLHSVRCTFSASLCSPMRRAAIMCDASCDTSEKSPRAMRCRSVRGLRTRRGLARRHHRPRHS